MVLTVFLVIAMAFVHALYVLIQVVQVGYNEVNYWDVWFTIPVWAFFIMVTI